ncbi:YpzG family protein [Ferdinandcohnia quinoae]|uniref:YpzG family protein n=1 Tax=Fredinandcohnia quinoae TaxID=2918902 RepID=A0AAW5E3M0_9BACI|nr:YpzG family protein [Fredinandcohnia sp. SECRCQ15]
MGKRRNDPYTNPFQSPWANPKHSWAQINGETMQTQNNIILQRETRKRS